MPIPAKPRPLPGQSFNIFWALVHQAAPDAGETSKWGMPFFTHQCQPLAMMAAFKAHAGVGIFDVTPMGNGDSMANITS